MAPFDQEIPELDKMKRLNLYIATQNSIFITSAKQTILSNKYHQKKGY